MTSTERFGFRRKCARLPRSVEQARQAFEGFISAAQRAMTAFEGQAESARQGAKDVTEKAMTFAERNITGSFDFAQRLVQAKDVEEMLKLQANYIKTQMQVLADQAKELGESTSKVARDAAKSNADGRQRGRHRTRRDTLPGAA